MVFARAKKREPVGEAELMEYALGALSRRMRTERDLRRLMAARAHAGEAGQRDIDRVVARLVELKYLSDERYAADYTRLRKENQGFGRRRVAMDLGTKGVGKEVADAALEQAYGDADEVMLVRGYCERKRIAKPEDAKAVQRVMGRLMRAGYSPGAIFKVLREWKVEVPEEEMLNADETPMTPI
jgi:regulatory protein